MKTEKYIPQPIDTSNVKLPEDLEQLVEQMSKNVHEVWAETRIKQGWTYGDERNDQLKTHPCLIPYEDLTEEEKDVLAGLMANLYKEIQADDSQYNGQDDIIRDYILLILDYCRRFYTRQFKEMTTAGGDILSRFQQVLIDYYNKGRQLKDGLPSVKYCASELCLSAGYFGDIVREALGESPKDYIRGFIMMRAKNLLLSGIGVTQVSEQLGFEYPNHFTRFFKQMTGKTPSRFFAEQQQK